MSFNNVSPMSHQVFQSHYILGIVAGNVKISNNWVKACTFDIESENEYTYSKQYSINILKIRRGIITSIHY